MHRSILSKTIGLGFHYKVRTISVKSLVVPKNGAVLSIGFGSYKGNDIEFEIVSSSPADNIHNQIFAVHPDGTSGFPGAISPRYQRPALMI